MTSPTTMRAVLHNQKTQTLSFGSFPLPKPSATQYLVKTSAVGLTAGELEWTRPEHLIVSSPGVEFVGRVLTSPSPSSKFQPGDEVYGRVTYPQPGAAREYTVSDDTELALRPKNLSNCEVATIPVGALTAWQAFFEKFQLAPPVTDSAVSYNNSQLRILITNASGGTGIWAVQLAKLIGAYVVGTCGPANIEFVRGLGADEVLDYHTTDIKAWAAEALDRKFDLVLDCAGGASLAQAWHALKEDGQLLSIVPPADMKWKWVLERPEGVSDSVSGRFFIMHTSGEQLAKITELAEQGRVKPVVDSVWALDEYQEAFERLASGHTRGKVVLNLDADQKQNRSVHGGKEAFEGDKMVLASI